MCSKRAPRIYCRGCCWRGSTASRRSNMSRSKPTRTGCGVSRGGCCSIRSSVCRRYGKPGRKAGQRSDRPMTETRIVAVKGRRVWDSRGRPTVEAELRLACGAVGRAIAAAGASTGAREASERRDGGARLGGRDVRGAVAAINGEIAAALTGMDAADQEALDAALVALDGTTQKSW